MNTAILDSRLWVPIKLVNRDVLKSKFEEKFFDEKQCSKCDYLPDRFCDVCAECPAYLDDVQLWRKRGNRIGVPVGDRVALKQLLKEPVKIVDKRAKPRIKTPIKLVSKLYPYQTTTVAAIAKAGYGVLKAPPRSGKTLMAVALALELGLRTLILAAQSDWLDQFMNEWETHTNLRDVEKWEGRKLVGICKTPESMVGYDVVLATYQSFISKNGKLRLDEIKDKFGLVVIDEAQGTPAQEYARVVMALTARYKIGLTATPKRKDQKHTILRRIIGPVKAEAHVETLKPKVYLHDTGVRSAHNYKLWAYAMRFLFTNKERNKVILKQLVADIKAKRSVVIPVGSIPHAKLLVHNINKHFGKEVAVQFTANVMNKTKRKELLDKARSGKIRCVVGTRQLVQTGINVPRWDTLYVVAPISNQPKFEQETSRIRTKMDGKPQPIIRHFLEDFGPSIGCFRTCLFQTYLKEKFEMDKATKARALAYVNSRKKQTMSTNFGIV